MTQAILRWIATTEDDTTYPDKIPNYPAGGVFLNTRCTTSHAPLHKQELVEDTAVLSATKEDARMQRIGRFESWAELVVPIEVVVDEWECAFTFDSEREHHLKRTNHGDTALDRVMKYVGQLFTRHHRMHVYALYVFRGQARILYFDRAYTIVSEPFKYGSPQDVALHAFFWRIARMSQGQLGFDPTVVPANPEDVMAMLAYAPDAPSEYVEEQIYRTLSMNPKRPTASTSSQWPPYELTMCGKRYIIARPIFVSPALYGRCTRGYLAYDIDGKAVRFIKDSWRLDLKRVQPEHEVYERFQRKGVTRGVLTCLGHENVPNTDGSWQRTRTQQLLSSSRPARGHYRLLFHEVCRPLTDFEDFEELTEIMCEAVIGTLLSVSIT